MMVGDHDFQGSILGRDGDRPAAVAVENVKDLPDKTQTKKAAADVRRPLLCLASLFRMRIWRRLKRQSLTQRGGSTTKLAW
jgi:hypothetical protein